MRGISQLIVSILIVTARLAQTQTPALSPVIEPALSPAPVVVHSDRTVTFRVWAPRAQAVGVDTDVPPLLPDLRVMTRDTSGVWSITVGPVPSNIWDYQFIVDGMEMPWGLYSVPASEPTFYDLRPVPHGTVHLNSYDSPSLRIQRRAYVYTPPGYETSSARYPVLYLLHPSGRTGASYWTVAGQANVILDNLIADGKAKSMVVVMPFGYPKAEDRDHFGERTEYGENNDLFAADLLNELIPFIEMTYRVYREPSQRAIAGASMGGLQALTIGLAHLDRFRWVGSFSGLGGIANPSHDRAGFVHALEQRFARVLNEKNYSNKTMRLLWFAAGDQEKGILARNQEFSALLDRHSIRHTFDVSQGWNHQPQLWRQNLHDFAQLLFVR